MNPLADSLVLMLIRITHLLILFNVYSDGYREQNVYYCRSFSKTKQAESTFLQWIRIGKEINTALLIESFMV